MNWEDIRQGSWKMEPILGGESDIYIYMYIIMQIYGDFEAFRLQ